MIDNLQKRLLYIDLMRAIIILFLIVMHSFTMYSGTNPSWPLPDTIYPIKLYVWIQKYTYAFLLESFTFISGYIYSYGISKKVGTPSFFSLFLNKFKRLIIPSIVFSIMFALIFGPSIRLNIRTIYDILMGIGHMWYLPMLFLCFIITHLVNKTKISEDIAIGLIIIISVFSFLVPNYMRISQALYYELFFYLGYIFNQKNIVVKKNYKSGLVLVVLVPALLYVNESLYIQNVLLYKTASNFVKIAYATLGSVALFSLCKNVFTTIKSKTMCTIVELSTLSMGIYLIQEFIIRIFYYKTPIPVLCGSITLPWITSLLTIVISTVLALLFRKNKIGRFIIG